MRASTLFADFVSVLAILSFTAAALAHQDGIWQRLRHSLGGKDDVHAGAVHQRDQDAYTSPYGYAPPPRPSTSTTKASCESITETA